MDSFSPTRHSPTLGKFRSTACAVLLALLCTTPALASLLVTSANRSVFADAGSGADPTASSTATAGSFDRAVADSTAAPNVRLPNDAAASQFSSLDPLEFSGQGDASSTSRLATRVNANSNFEVLFTLTSAYDYTGFAETLSNGIPGANAAFVFNRLGGGFNLTGSAVSPLIGGFSGLLDSGDYRLFVGASVDGFDLGTRAASFDFQLSFTEHVAPGGSVPEPSSMALCLGALVACGALRRRIHRRPASVCVE